MNGYDCALLVNQIDESDPWKFGEFHDWVANYFGWKESTAGWKTSYYRSAMVMRNKLFKNSLNCMICLK